MPQVNSELNRPVDLPSGWVWASLSDVAEITTGNPAPQGSEHFDPGGTPFVRVKDMGRLVGATWITETQDHLTQEAADRLRLFPRGTVLFTKSGASTLLNQRAILGRESCIVSHIGAALPTDGAMTSEWLYRWLSCVDFANYAHATTLPSLPLAKIRQIPVPVAPRQEQDRITNTLDHLFSQLDAAVSALERAKEKLKIYRASVLAFAVDGSLTADWRERNPSVESAEGILDRILTDRRRYWEEGQLRRYESKGKRPPKNWRTRYREPVTPGRGGLSVLPHGWCWATFDQLGCVQSGLQKSPVRAPRKNHYPYLRVANVLRGSLDLTTLHRFELQSEELDRLRLHKGDLLFVEGNGSQSEIGRCAVWRGEVANCVHQNHIIRVRPSAGFLPDYAQAFINSPQGQQAVQRQASSTSGLYTLSARKIRALTVPLPSPTEQAAIAAEVERAVAVDDGRRFAVEEGLARLRALRQALLHRAFVGKLVPQNTTDEPASVLLDRIATARKNRESPARPRRSRGRVGHSALGSTRTNKS